MKNPLERHQRVKRMNDFIKRLLFSFFVSFIAFTMNYKCGIEGGAARKTASYYKSKPNTWLYVYENLPDICLKSILTAIPLTFLIAPFVKDN